MSDERSIHVLVVDDSAVVRQTMSAILRHEGFEVTTAADPIIALARLEEIEPDVMLLDLEMPRMDGLSFLRQVMSERPMPVVICSATAAQGTNKAVQALEEGALDVVVKPQHAVRDFLNESSVTLRDTIRAAAAARIAVRPAAVPVVKSEPKAVRRTLADSPTIIAIGASTGGTDALRTILRDIEPDSPGIVIVQHMPAKFTAAFAKSLASTSQIDVREAVTGDVVTNGTALVAPGGRHMVVARSGGRYIARIIDGPLVVRQRPSVDVLFRSVAAAAGPNAVGALLTGMGSDGAEGLLAMRRAGAATIAQDETTSVVFGMPKEAIRAGAASSVLPLHEMATAIKLAARATARRYELQRSPA